MAERRREVDLQEAAGLLGVPPSVIQSWKDRGRVGPTRILRGRRSMFWLDELEVLAASYRPRRRRHADEDRA